jgi:outer membrane receptor protein involved in Fe transport
MLFPRPRFFASLAVLPVLLAAALSLAPGYAAEVAPQTGTVAGTIIDQAPSHPVESVAVTLTRAGGAAVQTTVTDRRGRFTLDNVPPGEYRISYGYVGSESRETAPFTLAAPAKAIDLGALDVGDPALKLEKFEVTAKQREFSNSIDRKTYSVGREIQSATGSASDLLQNIPSVQVDIDGNVSLRGSDNVLILVNGRTSTLMGKSRAEVLQQLPADSIDKIEVITNPSAKYKPDGTAGIINITLKQKPEGGVASTVNASTGNNGRYNAGVSANYRAGPWSVFGSLSVRQDDRPRRSTDVRTIINPLTGAATTLAKTSLEHSRPFFRLARVGVEYSLDDRNKVGLTGNYDHRTFHRTATDHNVVQTGAGAVTSDYDRTRYDPEFERSAEASLTYQHRFLEPDHELNLEFKSSSTKEQEDNHYADIFRRPAQVPTLDNTLIQPTDRNTEAIAEYTRPMGDDGKLEAGYTRSAEHLFTNFQVSPQNLATGLFLPDPARSSRFAFDQTIHAFYVTYGRTFGPLGVLAGLRPEAARTKSLLVNTGEVIANDYFRVYPTLHLAYQLRDHHELQLNYSHRVHRPESDDLNPFPEYADPFTLRAGNPRLKPEDIHSVEAGYQFKDDNLTFISTVYHRYLYNGFTNVTRDIGNSVLLTTHENLATSRSTGLELAATADLGKLVSLNFSSNTYFNTIDASNLGFSGSKSDVSWSAKLGASLHATKNTLFQFNTNYASTRLTAQGSRRPVFVANLGLRQDFLQKKLALVLTVSDLFNSLKESYLLDTPVLHEEVTRRRSARITYVGFIYNFGKPAKKPKDDALKFDNQL